MDSRIARQEVRERAERMGTMSQSLVSQLERKFWDAVNKFATGCYSLVW